MAYSQISVTQTFLRIFKYYLRPFENEEVISAIRKKFPKRFRIWSRILLLWLWCGLWEPFWKRKWGPNSMNLWWHWSKGKMCKNTINWTWCMTLRPSPSLWNFLNVSRFMTCVLSLKRRFGWIGCRLSLPLCCLKAVNFQNSSFRLLTVWGISSWCLCILRWGLICCWLDPRVLVRRSILWATLRIIIWMRLLPIWSRRLVGRLAVIRYRSRLRLRWIRRGVRNDLDRK